MDRLITAERKSVSIVDHILECMDAISGVRQHLRHRAGGTQEALRWHHRRRHGYEFIYFVIIYFIIKVNLNMSYNFVYLN
jgi:hypothetical protein